MKATVELTHEDLTNLGNLYKELNDLRQRVAELEDEIDDRREYEECVRNTFRSICKRDTAYGLVSARDMEKAFPGEDWGGDE